MSYERYVPSGSSKGFEPTLPLAMGDALDAGDQTVTTVARRPGLPGLTVLSASQGVSSSGSAPADSSAPAMATSSLRSFGEYSEFLRAAMADEESLQMGESLQALSHHIEAITQDWSLPQAGAKWLLPGLAALSQALVEHHSMVLDLNNDWGRFLEFKAHMASLNQFRAQVEQWQRQVALPGALPPPQSDFDVSAWRMLGAGSLLLDVYEQSSHTDRSEASQPSSAWSRLVGWIRNVE